MSYRDIFYGRRERRTAELAPRLSVQLEQVAAKRGIANEGRRQFMAALKHSNGRFDQIPPEVMTAREERIKKLQDIAMWREDEPTDAHIEMAMWGHSPDPEALTEWANKDTKPNLFFVNGVVHCWLEHRAELFEKTLEEALALVEDVSGAPVEPVENAKKSWLFRFRGGQWCFEHLVGYERQHLTGYGLVLHASKDLAHQRNLPTHHYFSNLMNRMSPPGDLGEGRRERVARNRHKVGVVNDDDYEMDLFSVNDNQAVRSGQVVGQRWKMPKAAWEDGVSNVGKRLQRDESAFPNSTRGMLGLEG